MIRVKIEMCPRGDERPEAVREIGRMYIANTGGHLTRGDYEVAVCRRGSSQVPAPIDPDGPKPTRAGSVTGYPRLAYNVWRLIARSVLACFPEEATIKLLGDVAALQDADIASEASDADALELGREIVTPGQEADMGVGHLDAVRAIGRAAWTLGARPRGF